MNVLLTGSTGFIGRHLLRSLLAAGHRVVCTTRDPDPKRRQGAPGTYTIAADFTRDHDPSAWMPRLAGVDVVINAVGILREHGSQTFRALHERAPWALFSAASEAGVRMVVQISALGADEAATSRYHLSKKRADDFLSSLPVHSVVVQPSLIFGADGASARMFSMLASLPVIPLPGSGAQRIQPIHIDDVCDAILRLIENSPTHLHVKSQPESLPSKTRLPLVGPQVVTLRQYIGSLRETLGLGIARFVPVPLGLVRATAGFGRLLPNGMLDAETLQMLERGNTGSDAPMRQLLGRAPHPPDAFVGAGEKAHLRIRASLDWLLPILRLSIAIVWIVTGIVSMGLYPVADSYYLLARVGVTGMLAALMLYGAAVLDIALGIGILLLSRRRWLWLAQIALITFYTALITWRMPEFWLHPYGPLLKNLPMLAAIWLLYELDER